MECSQTYCWMTTPCGSETLRAQLQIPGIDSLSPQEIANMINAAFLQPMQAYQSINPPPPFELTSNQSMISVQAVSSVLRNLPHKAPGPDGIPNWVLKEYALLLSNHICRIIFINTDEIFSPRAMFLIIVMLLIPFCYSN